MPALAIHDETTAGRRTHRFVLDVPGEAIPLRELIARRVRAEVAEYSAQRHQYCRGLVQPSDAEQTLNGYRVRDRRAIDAERQVAHALHAFVRNGFFVIVDDRLVESLDQAIAIRADTQVSFVTLVPRVGG